jgi:DNA-directed RNA polymerase specialized sigma24 family protein
MYAEKTIWRDLKTLASRYHHGTWKLPMDRRKQVVVQAIEQLPEQARMLLALRYYEGLGVDELAEALRSNPNAIREAIGKAVESVYRSLIQAERLYGERGA